MEEDGPAEEQPLRSSWARWREAALGATGTPQAGEDAPEGEESPRDLDLQLDWPEGPVPRDAAAEAAAATAVAPSPAAAPAAALDPPAATAAAPAPVAAGARSSYEPVWAETDEEPAPRAAAVPLLPAMASRLDTLHGGLAALSMRFDALAAATNAFRATTGDRIEECLDAIVRTGRATTKALAEQTRTTDRALAELRRSVDDAGDAVQALGARGGGLAGSDLNEELLGALSDDLGSIRDLVAAVLDGLPASAEGSGTDVGAIASTIDQKVDALATDVDTSLASLRDELVHLRRRIGMRGRGAGGGDEGQPASLTDDDVDRIAARVASHLAAQADPLATAPARGAPTPVEDEDDEPKPARRPRRATAKPTEPADAAAPRRRAPRRTGA